MKILIAILVSSFAFAQPQKLVGEYQRTKVIPLSRIIYEFAFSIEQVEKFKADGFTCVRSPGKYICKKLEQITSLPAEVTQAFLDHSPKKLNFTESLEEYSEDFKSDSYTEWSRRQSVSIDEQNFKNISWRENSSGPTRIIFQNDQARIEFLVEKDNLQFMQKYSYTDPNTRKTADYWGLLLFTFN